MCYNEEKIYANLGLTGMRGMRRGTLLEKCPPDPPQNFLGKSFELSEGWRALIKVK
jgi:hypothetical protein